ncbi:MAG: amidase family protein [Bacteroidota bacterium]
MVSDENNSNDLSDIATKDFREFKVLDSKFIKKSEIWESLNTQMADFSEENYTALKPLILEKDIPFIQNQISQGKLTYEGLTKFYLYRIRKFDRENDLSVNSVIAINPNIIDQARLKDKEHKTKSAKHPIFGMPILLKDNINTLDLPTTAGSIALQKNYTKNAFITQKLVENGALILGKANLSEWAYFFCGDCPSGYSAIGGQTLNPYGRRTIDTGGSSSGSGVAVAANFCVAAVGSETAGSILSPSSQNSAVGLKPTVGLLSRTGIVPISSTLDTPGPITKNVTDNAILLDAMKGFDATDFKSFEIDFELKNYYDNLSTESLNGKRFGAMKELMKDSLYKNAIDVLKNQGAEIVQISAEEVGLPDFIRLLNLDMKADLADYFAKYMDKDLKFSSIEDVMAFNETDSINIMPYGQRLFKGVSNDAATKEEFDAIKDILKSNGRRFFDLPMKAQNLDGILSINNYHAAEAAVAEYPALTIPMGYTSNGTPKGLTFISKTTSEKDLLDWAFAYEKASKMRVAPENYK